MDDCLFCKIINGEIKADIIGENSEAVALRDINPAAPVHFLVVPREHITSLKEFGAEKTNAQPAVFGLIREAAELEGIGRSGYRVIMNIGEDAGQEVDHLHFHVLGGRKLTWPPG